MLGSVEEGVRGCHWNVVVLRIEKGDYLGLWGLFELVGWPEEVVAVLGEFEFVDGEGFDKVLHKIESVYL